jgi:hypothetical protein
MATTQKASMEKAMEAIFASAFLTEKDGQGVPVMLFGNPGVGKSKFVEIVAHAMGYEFLDIELNSRTEEDLKGYMTTPDKVDTEFVVASTILPNWYRKIKEWTDQKKKVILFFDEINTAPEHVQAAALTLIQGRRFQGIKLPNTVVMVAAGNYFENINLDDMQPMVTVLNRFCLVNISVTASMSGNDDFAVMRKRYNGVKDTGRQLTWDEAYADYYQDKLTEFSSKCLTKESEKEINLRETLEMLVADEVITTTERLSEVDKAINLNDKRLANLYSDCPTPNKDLYNILTPRSLDALVQMSGGFYRMWGLDSLLSDSFADVINGLVGVGVAPKSNGKNTMEDVKYVLIGNHFYAAIKQAVDGFRVKSDDKVNKRINLFNEFLAKAEASPAKSGKKKVNFFDETMFPQLEEYFKSFQTEIKNVTKPIDTAALNKMFEYLINTTKVDSNYDLPVQSAKCSVTFLTMDDEEKIKYINNDLANNYKHWLDWWGVVRSFSETFGQKQYGYQGAIPVRELMVIQSRIVQFFTSVSIEFNSNPELMNQVSAQVKPLISNMTVDSIQNDFQIKSEISDYFYRNSVN